MMPTKQLHRQLEKSFGVDWRSRLASFDETPIAAASIGQVGRSVLQRIERKKTIRILHLVECLSGACIF